MTRNTLTVLCIAALATTATAGTSLSSVDWQAAGDGLLTNDSATGLQWLDWAHTANRSYNDVSSQLGAGGEFEGFRYATEAEMRTLYTNAGAVTIAPIDGTDAANIPALELLSGLLGETFVGGSEAIYDLPGSNAVNQSSFGDFGGSGPYHMGTAFLADTGQIAVRWINFDDNAVESFMGHALVQVPAPGSAALLGLGGLFAARRRRH
jgi:hypothetical protein